MMHRATEPYSTPQDRKQNQHTYEYDLAAWEAGGRVGAPPAPDADRHDAWCACDALRVESTRLKNENERVRQAMKTHDEVAKAAIAGSEKEIHRLRDEIKTLKDERDEWRRIAGRLANAKKQRDRADEAQSLSRRDD